MSRLVDRLIKSRRAPLDTDLEPITVMYPRRKIRSLERLYGTTLRVVMGLALDRLIAESSEVQLYLNLTDQSKGRSIKTKPQLTSDEIASIKALVSTEKISDSDVARRFGVHRMTIFNIRHDKYKKYSKEV